MNKSEFLSLLKTKLSGLPDEDIRERLAFYAEMIDDRVEEGLTEAEAVAEVGSADSIALQAASEIPLTKLVKAHVKPKRRLSALEITLLALGSPIWLALLISLFAVMLSLYAVLWALIISLWAVEISLAACAVLGAIVGILRMFTDGAAQGLAVISAGAACAGLFCLLLPACRASCSGAWRAAKKLTLGIKKLFIGKGNKQNEANDR